MKIRTGFVSNSSTTSFILVTTQKAYDEVLSKFDYKQKKFIKMMARGRKVKGFGRNDLSDYSGTYDSEGIEENYNDIFHPSDDEDSSGQDLLDNFLSEFETREDSYVNNDIS